MANQQELEYFKSGGHLLHSSIIRKYASGANTRSRCYDSSFDYTTHVNNWLHRTPYVTQSEQYKEQRYEEGKYSAWECRRDIKFQHGVLMSSGVGGSKKEARNRADHGLYERATENYKKKNIDMIKNIMAKTEAKPKVQADGEVPKESNQGLTAQDSNKESNTIITRDEGITSAYDNDQIGVDRYLSAEKVFDFEDLVGRLMPLPTLEVKTEQAVGDIIQTYYLPESLFTAADCAPNLVPFEAFIYSRLNLEMHFIVNAQKFQCGKVICSVKFDSYQADAMQLTAMAALNRPHIILDLSSNNQGILKIPFRYHRGFVRNVKNDANSKGVRPSKYASVYVQYLSPLRSGTSSATNMFITPYYVIKQGKFAAMSYRVKVQMELADDVINTAYKASGLKSVLTRFENMAQRIGGDDNMDKPIHYTSNIFIPRPRMNFGVGKGLSDAQPLRNNPFSLTSSKWIKAYDDEPRTTTQIARIWGLRDSFQWKSDNAPNTTLWTTTVDPMSRSYTAEYSGTPTPLEYVCGMYNFWTGSIEYRFDFVSNAYHTGAVMISIEYGRPVLVTPSACSKASTYTKTFHLGEQKSVRIVVPYIYDTVFRRTTSTAYNPNFSADAADAATDTTRYNAIGLRPESKTVVRVTVMNDLRPIATTTQVIDVLVYMRAGRSFIPHSLKQMSYVLTRESTGAGPKMDSFPRDGYKVTDDATAARNKREAANQPLLDRFGKPMAVSFRDLPPGIRNEWNEVRADMLGQVKARTQADTGDKEDLDSTDNFRHGLVSLPLQTSDVQTSLKDILRRPVLLVYRHTVKSNLTKGEQFFLPVMPPSREFNYHAGQNDAFSDLVGQTPQAAIMNLFRFWRGGSRYTIFVHAGSAEPVYVTYIPHTGTRIIGNQVIGNDLATGKERPIMGCGLTTEPILPIVNSSTVVEVPYDTENFWTLTFEEDAQRNYAWRDKGDTNAGHLCITATVDIQVSIWWSAADDFDIANFYGIPICKNRDANYQWSDAHGRVQMDEDFRVNEGRTLSSTLNCVKQEMSKLTDPKVLVKAALGSLPMIGPAIVGAPIAAAVEDLAHQSGTSLKTLNKTLSSVDVAAQSLNIVTSQLAPLVATINNYLSGITNECSSITLWTERLIDFITDISCAWYQSSWCQVGVSCIKLIAKILMVNVSVLSDYTKSFIDAITAMVTTRVQAPSEMSTIVGTIAGMVGLVLGVVLNPLKYSSYSRNISMAFLTTTGISYINQVIRFVQTIFDMLKDMIMDALGYKSPEAVALKMLSGKDLLLKSFIAGAQGVINEANSNMVLHPRFRVKFWYTVTQAYQIQQVLSMVPANVISPQLSKLCSEVIKVGNEKMMDLSCSPVRYEPFVICIEGVHGIGKSYLTESLISHLLNAVGFTRNSSGWTYTRAPGSKFWSGYRDQPAIIYDDWLNLNDAQLMSQQISELYQLKSTSTFIPEMAHLEEKRIKANPMIVVLLCNGAFPSGMANVAHHPSAVYRRRDVVLHARVKSEYQGVSPRDLPSDVSRDIGHLEFQRYLDPTNGGSKTQTCRTWKETAQWLAQSFQHYHAQEEVNVRTRVNVLREQLQVDAAEAFDFEDPFSLLYKSTEFISSEEFGNNAWLPSEKLEAAVVEIVEKIKQKKNLNVPIIIPPKPDDIFVQYDCCPASWEELLIWFTKGVLITPEMWSKILKFSTEGLTSVVDKITSLCTTTPVGECCVCNEVGPVSYACVDSQYRHRICVSCWRNVELLSPTVACPVCRSNNVGLYVEYSDGVLATILVWCASLVGDYVVPAMQFVTRLLSRFGSRAMSKIQLIGELIVGYSSSSGIDTRQVAAQLGRVVTAEIVNPSETFFDAVEEMGQQMTDRPLTTVFTGVIAPALRHNRHDQLHRDVREWWPHQRTNLSLPSSNIIDQINESTSGGRVITRNGGSLMLRNDMHVQADDDWDVPVPVRDVAAGLRTDPIGECALNPAGFAACRTPKISRLPQCYHALLLENIDTIIYRDSQVLGPAWQLPLEISGELQIVMVLDNPCQHNCVWENENVHREFCEQYIQRKRATIARAQIQYVGTLQANPAEFLKSIPRFARPMWAVENNTIPQDMTPDNWWKYLSDQWENYKNMIIVTGIIAGTMGAVCLTYSQISSWFTGSSVQIRGAPQNGISYWANHPDFQSDPNYNPEHSRYIQRATRDIRPVRVARTQADNLGEVVEGYICKNYVRIIVSKDDKCRYLTAVGIFGHFALIPRHYVKLLSEANKNGKKIELAVAMIEWAGSRYTRQEYTFDDKDFISSPVSDIAFFKLPASFNMFKDIRKFIVTQKDLNNYINSQGRIILAPTREKQIAQVVPILIDGYQQSEIFIDGDETNFEAFHVLRYSFSKMGACGSVVCLEDTQRPIVAMHCAGHGEGIYGTGYGVLLTQESIADMLPQGITVQCEEVDHESMADAKFIFDEDCQVEYLGTVPVHLQPHIPQKTKIQKSLLHNQYGFKALTEPTILSSSDPRYTHPRSPLFYGASKHGKKTVDFPSSLVTRAGQALWDGWLCMMDPAVVAPTRLSYEQAVMGFEGNKYYEAMSLNTSSGYPWNLRGETTKDGWIKVDWDARTCEIHSELLEELKRKEELRKNGIVPETIFVDTLKDERKISEKVRKAGATRVFCASPVDYTIALRQNYLHFCAAYMKNRHSQMHGVGINVHGSEWARLMTRLSKHPNFIALDYSNFGPAFNACIAKKASDLMKKWTQEKVAGIDIVELDAINWECDASVHLCGNTLYRQTCGSPSGASITVIKNSLVNLLYIMCAWDVLTVSKRQEQGIIDSWMEFRSNTEVCVYGDDVIMTVSDLYATHFNTITIQNWFSKFKIASTGITKEGVSTEPFMKRQEVSFLKRKWVKHPTRFGEYLAPLDIISVNDITQWVWKSADKRQATRINCESALLEAHGYGPYMYEEIRRKINEALSKIKIIPITLTWYDIDQKYYEEEQSIEIYDVEGI